LNKLFWFCLLILLLFCSIKEQPVSNFNVKPLEIETKREIGFDNQVYLWYELTQSQKINLIIKMVDIAGQ